MIKKNIIIAVLGVLVVIGVALWVNMAQEKEYSVVYMSTGEVYVGFLSTFPDFELEDGYILQVVQNTEDPTKSTFNLQPVSDALWAPKEMHLIKDNIIFYGPLTPNSKIAQTLSYQTK